MDETTYKYASLDNSVTTIGEFYSTNRLFMFLEGLTGARLLEHSWKYTIGSRVRRHRRVVDL